MLGGPAEAAGEDHGDLFGAADADVVLHQGLEEATGAARVVENQGPADLDLAHGQLPPIASGAVIGRERGQNEGKRALEEASEVAWPEAVADPLEGVGVLTGGESVGQRSEGEPDLGRLALGPLVTVAPDLGRIGEVRDDLDEPGPELGVIDVEDDMREDPLGSAVGTFAVIRRAGLGRRFRLRSQ